MANKRYNLSYILENRRNDMVRPMHGNSSDGEVEDDFTWDWRTRSLAVKKLSRIAHPTRAPLVAVEMPPRVLIQYWDDNVVPSDVAACMATWDALIVHGFKHFAFDRAGARDFISQTFTGTYVSAFDAARHPAIRSDYFRLCYLAALGGWYVDADDVYQGTDLTPLFEPRGLRLQALCYDLDNDQMADAAKALDGPDDRNVIHYVNNNPMIARAQHPVVVEALRHATSSLLRNSSTDRVDVQAVAGPGAISLVLARQSRRLASVTARPDLEIRTDWEAYARPVWDLAYRRDGRDWRTWDGLETL